MNRRSPILELAALLHPLTNPWKALALIQAYFDESGTHDEALITMIAGYVATAETWAQVEAQWNAEMDPLAKKYGVTWFHMADCQALRGKKKWRRIQKPERDRLIERLSDILAAAEVFTVWGGVNTAEWAEITTPAFRERFPKPYDLCFDEVVRQLWWWSRHNADRSPVSIVFAEQKEYEGRNALAYETWSRHRRASQWLGALAYDRPQRIAALQTADMLAYEATKEWEGIEYGELSFETNFQLRPLLHKITRRHAMHSGALYGRDGLRTAVARFHTKGAS